VPTLAQASGGIASFAPVQGLLFSCLMAAISIGGELYNLASHFGLSVEAIGVGIYATAAACMGAPAWSKWRLGGPMAGLNGLIRLHLKAWGCPPHS